MSYLVTRTVVYSQMVEASSESEAIEFAQELGWSEKNITEDITEAET